MINNNNKGCSQVRKPRVSKPPLGFFRFGRKIRIAIPQLRLQYTMCVVRVRAKRNTYKKLSRQFLRGQFTRYIPFSSQRLFIRKLGSSIATEYCIRVYYFVPFDRQQKNTRDWQRLPLVSRGQMRSNSGRKERLAIRCDI